MNLACYSIKSLFEIRFFWSTIEVERHVIHSYIKVNKTFAFSKKWNIRLLDSENNLGNILSFSNFNRVRMQFHENIFACLLFFILYFGLHSPVFASTCENYWLDQYQDVLPSINDRPDFPAQLTDAFQVKQRFWGIHHL